ncbi:DUF6371 domain-containing protein [Spirosoma knui]
MSNKDFRYQLPKKAVKIDCPLCGPKHRKTLSPYIDTRTGEPLPDIYGRCDRESNCGYHLNPYQKGPSGLSYHDEVKARYSVGSIPKAWFKIAAKQKNKGITKQGIIIGLVQMEQATLEQAEYVAAYIFDKPTRAVAKAKMPINEGTVYTIPDEIFEQSLGHYERNLFAYLLRCHLGMGVADELLERFQIGTSTLWPGACVFWYIDELGRKRGGQIKLFDDNFHTVKYKDREGNQRSKTSWVHSALLRKYTQQEKPVPEWLQAYEEHAERSPCLFGLPQLLTAPIDQPVAIVEAPKTAVICSAYFKDYMWLAVGALSYLNAQRLAPLRARNIELYPDLSKDGTAFNKWNHIANDLLAKGYKITVSSYLEDNATIEEKVGGYDMADFLLEQWLGYPLTWNI